MEIRVEFALRRMPDADLADDPRQSIQLANEAMWHAATGLNALGTIQIASDSSGWPRTAWWASRATSRSKRGEKRRALMDLVDQADPFGYKPRPCRCGSNSVVECNLAKVDVASSNLVSRSE